MNTARVLELLDELRAEIGTPAVPLAVMAPAPAPAPVGGVRFTDYGAFYDFLRGNALLGPKISQSEYDGCNAIIIACQDARWGISWTAYALATAYLETAHTMQPVKEMGGLAYYTRMYDIKGQRPAKATELGNLSPGDGAKYCGRGYPQVTGKNNYAKATAVCKAAGINVDLVANPELMLRDDVAALVMVSGMSQGWFTGRKLSDDLPLRGPATLRQFVASRDIINGHDREGDVAAYAVQFQNGLSLGGYQE